MYIKNTKNGDALNWICNYTKIKNIAKSWENLF